MNCKLGDALNIQGKFSEAVDCYRNAIDAMPNYAEAHNNLGVVYNELEMFDQAVDCYHRALELNPNYPEAYNNLGLALHEQGKLTDAIFHHQRALELKPNFAQALYNLGNVFNTQGNIKEAINYYDQALVLKPDDEGARMNRAFAMLLTGNFEQGWREYDGRWKVEKIKQKLLCIFQPQWKGASLTGKTLLVLTEQGLGDTLQFIRYTKLLTQLGARILLTCPPVLVPLLSTYPGIDQIIAEGDPLPYYDYYIPLLSLPRVFKTDSETIPANIPYLYADAALNKQWSQKLAKFSDLRIGINWHGREAPGQWQRRDLPLSLFSRLAQLPGLQLFSLQKGTISPEEQRLLEQSRIISFGDDFDTTNGPFMDTAAIMMNLDLVITSDTSVAHLAGALGVPVWVALPFVPDWRWLLDREDSPWYPTMRLFRQTKRDVWDDVFVRMLIELKNNSIST